MDPFSLTASIITVITLAGQLVSLGNSYVSSVRGCEKEIRELLAETSALSQVLITLKGLVDPKTATLETPIILSGVLVDTVKKCTSQLKEIIDFLAKRQTTKSGVRKMIGRLKWQLDKATIGGWIESIEGFKSTLTVAFSADGMSVTRAISIDVVELRRGQEMARNQQKLEDMNERLQNIQRWLSPTDSQINYSAARKLQHAGTGKWFVEGSRFREWFQKDNSFIWIHGILGAGKTILSSIIIDKIAFEARSKDIKLVYFYCDSKEPAKQCAKKFYGSLIAQILKQISTSGIPKEIDTLYEKYSDKSATLNNLKDVFSNIIQSFPKVAIIVDGLDECIDRTAVIDGLLELKDDPSINTNILVTSRNDLSMRLALSGVSNVAMEASKVGVDIESYIMNEMERNGRLKRLKPEVKAEITAELVQSANGMFRWAKCRLEQVAMLRNDKAIRQTLHNFPPNQDLDEAYEKILTKIQYEDKDLAIRVFQWLVCSVRSMTIEEVTEGISIEIGNTILDPGNRLNDPEDILDICEGLVSLDRVTRILRFAHFSVKEYLTSERIAESLAASYQINEKITHIKLAKSCLTYISFGDFDSGPCQTDDELKCRLEKYPLLEYAAHSWQQHATNDDKKEDNELTSMIEEFLEPLSSLGNFLSWAQVYHTEFLEYNRNHTAYKQCSLLVSVEFKDYCLPLFSEVLRQPNCGCRAVDNSPW